MGQLEICDFSYRSYVDIPFRGCPQERQGFQKWFLQGIKIQKRNREKKSVLFFVKSDELDGKCKILSCEQVILINGQGLIGKIE